MFFRFKIHGGPLLLPFLSEYNNAMKANEPIIVCNPSDVSISQPANTFSMFDDSSRVNALRANKDEELVSEMICRIRCFDYDFVHGPFLEADADMLSERQDLVIRIVKELIEKRDDVGIRKMAFLVNSQICNVPKEAIFRLVSYCFASSKSNMQCEGITLIASFPCFSLMNRFSSHCFQNPFVEREWRRLKAKHGLLPANNMCDAVGF